MTARTIVIVGATSGIGKAVAVQLAHDGHRILAAGRDSHRADALRSRLNAASQVIVCDVATLQGCAQLVEAVSGHTDHVDALINNAGVMEPEHRLTTDGHELNLAVHHLAPFAVTSRLLPLLRNGSIPGDPDGHDRPRVVNVNSAGHHTSLNGHRNPTLDFADLTSAGQYDPFLAYSRSKLANLLFTYELARRYGHELLVNALHPGLVRTDIGRSFPRWRVLAAQAMGIAPARAAPAVTRLATETVTTNGGYYDRTTLTRSSGPSYDTGTAARLWQVTEQICGPFDPGRSLLTEIP